MLSAELIIHAGCMIQGVETRVQTTELIIHAGFMVG